MTKSDIGEVYKDLEALIDEICEFLSESVKNEELTGKSKLRAASLIERSKTQLQKLSKFSKSCPEDVGSYVDMGKNNTKPNQTQKSSSSDEEEVIPEYVAIYSPVENEPDGSFIPMPIPAISIVEDVACPYNKLPASEAMTDKYGYLEKREKFVVFFTKRVFATVHNKWLLLYTSEKDLKPIEMYSTQSYQAKCATTMKEKSFEIIKHGDTSGKSVFFTATTKKDMLQWVAAFNRKKIVDEVAAPVPKPLNNTLPKSSKGKSPNNTLPRRPSDTLPNKPPMIVPPPEIPNNTEVETEEDQIYEELQPIAPGSTKKEPISPKKVLPVLPPRLPVEPPLPVRNVKKELPAMPPSPRLSETSEQLEEYDIIDPDSFSDDSGECTYDIVINSHPPELLKPHPPELLKPPPPPRKEPSPPPPRKEPSPLPILPKDDFIEDEEVEYDLIINEPQPAKSPEPPSKIKTIPSPLHFGPKAEIKPKPAIRPKLFWKDKTKLASPVSPPVVPNFTKPDDDSPDSAPMGRVNSFVHQFSKRNRNNP